MTYLGPFLAGLIVGIVAVSFVLHWLAGLAEVVNSRSGKPRAQVVRKIVIVTIVNSGFWILIVVAFVAYHVFSTGLDKPLIIGAIGFASAIALLSVVGYGFARGGTGSLFMRLALSMRRKENFMRFGFIVTFIVVAPMLYEWYEQGLSFGLLVFAAILWTGGMYFVLWYMWQFVPWDKPGLVRDKKDGGSSAA